MRGRSVDSWVESVHHHAQHPAAYLLEPAVPEGNNCIRRYTAVDARYIGSMLGSRGYWAWLCHMPSIQNPNAQCHPGW
jgi:hypothetical protein